ncbi:hypothetical protein CHUAL_013168 [Chamberlinius hualienensis]
MERVRKEPRSTCVARLRSVRLFSTNNCLHKNDGDDSGKAKYVDDKSENKRAVNAQKKAKSEPAPAPSISSKLIDQILSMKVSGGNVDDSSNEMKFDLARPNERRSKRIREKKVVEEIQSEAPGLSVDLIKATKEVAASIGGDVTKTKSELLSKLLLQVDETKKQSSRAVGDILSGMIIDRPKLESDSKNQGVSGDYYQAPKRYVPKTDIFGARRLNIFSKQEKQSEGDVVVLKTWARLQQRELDLLVTHPPRNAFEEEIHWLKQGKVWSFPIDNEQGMDDEKKIGFHQHVFLDNLISDFPKKGPVRHFMELVIVGLSKNPFITVEQKKADIEWFRQYFKDKHDVLKTVGAVE